MVAKTFWLRVADEIEPVLRHTVVVACLQLLFVAMLLFMKVLERLYPAAKELCHTVEVIDKCFIAAVLSMFAVYTAASIAKLMWMELRK